MISKSKFYYLYNKNSPQNPKRNIGPIDARLFLRNLSLPIAYFLAKKGTSPTSVTVFFLGISIIATMLFAIPSFLTMVSLVILLEIAQLFDCVDGQLARFYNICSQKGENLDTFAHVLTSSLFMFAFGLRLSQMNGQMVYLYLGIIGGLVKAFDHLQIITHTTVLDTQYVQKLFNKSTASRYILYGLQSLVSEVRIFGALLILLAIIEYYFPTVKLVEISFITLFVISFLENFLYSLSTIVTLILHKRFIKI